MIGDLVAMLIGMVLCIPFTLGLYLLYVGLRFKASAAIDGVEVDQSAFWLNWLAFTWLWAERSAEIVQAMPFFQKDLSETFGVKKDDGRVT